LLTGEQVGQVKTGDNGDAVNCNETSAETAVVSYHSVLLFHLHRCAMWQADTNNIHDGLKQPKN